jgi:hypothetical protein
MPRLKIVQYNALGSLRSSLRSFWPGLPDVCLNKYGEDAIAHEPFHPQQVCMFVLINWSSGHLVPSYTHTVKSSVLCHGDMHEEAHISVQTPQLHPQERLVLHLGREKELFKPSGIIVIFSSDKEILDLLSHTTLSSGRFEMQTTDEVLNVILDHGVLHNYSRFFFAVRHDKAPWKGACQYITFLPKFRFVAFDATKVADNEANDLARGLFDAHEDVLTMSF